MNSLITGNARRQIHAFKSGNRNAFSRCQPHRDASAENFDKTTSSYEEQDLETQRHSSTLPATKSDILLASLGACAEYYFVSESSQKWDLSFASHSSLSARSKKTVSKRKRSLKKCSEFQASIQTSLRSKKRSLSSFLSLYITYIDPIRKDSQNDDLFWTSDQKLREDVLEAFSDANNTWLQTRGYSIADLVAWRWIISACSSETAIARLVVLANSRKYGFTAGHVPIFLVLLLLRRRDFNDCAFRTIITFVWGRLLDQDALENSGIANDNAGPLSVEASPKMDEHLFFRQGNIIVLIIRLWRRAREVWPAALPSVAEIATRYLGRAEKTKNPTPDTPANLNHRRLSSFFNSLLCLLALPTSKEPFVSIISRERAQFIIIRKMTQFDPPLVLNRKGYRAVAQVQIAHRKTIPEREWATLKAKSWPPWRQLRSGIDSDIGKERGISRAAEVIMRSQEAGYAEQGWDTVAKIYAGWDTDDSPTIQTRALVPRYGSSGSLLHSYEDSDAIENDVRTWSARIQATRTISEAWACFSNYRNSQIRSGKRYSQFPYFVMFEKIIFEEKRRHLSDSRSANMPAESLEISKHHPLPGDGKETWPDPGPQQIVYVRTPVPNFDTFFTSMIEDGIIPGGKFLEFLMHHATTLQRGEKILKASCLSRTTKESFLQGITTAELCAMNVKIFTAYIHCLCRHAYTALDSDSQSRKSFPVSYAFQLMEKRKPSYWPPWNFLMWALRRERAVVDSGFYGRNALVQDAIAWSVMLYLLYQLRNAGLSLQFSCFQSLCAGLEKSTLASRKLIRILDRGTFVDDDGLEECTPAGQQLRHLLERAASESLEKSTRAGWKLLRGLPHSAFDCVEPSENSAKVLQSRAGKFAPIGHMVQDVMAHDPEIRGVSFEDVPGAMTAPDRLISHSTSPNYPGHGNEKLLRSRRKNLARIRYNAKHVVGNGLEILKACFEELVGITKASDLVNSPEPRGESEINDFSSITLLPRLLEVPHPSDLHAFIRVLGIHHDYEGILNVVQWMDQFATELYHQSMESMNGERRMRTLLTAIRIFLEGHWQMDDDSPNDDSNSIDEANRAAPAGIVQQVNEIILKQDFWGGWPTDEEIDIYILNGKERPDYSEECCRFESDCQDQPSRVRMRNFKKWYT